MSAQVRPAASEPPVSHHVPDPFPVASLGPWMLSSTVAMVLAVTLAKLSQWLGSLSSAAALWGALMTVGAAFLYGLAARCALFSELPGPRARALVISSIILVVALAWAALVVIFFADVSLPQKAS